jgi:hypothetical protein
MIQEFVHMHCVPSLFQELGYADAIAKEDWSEVDGLFRRNYAVRRQTKVGQVLDDLRKHDYLINYRL